MYIYTHSVAVFEHLPYPQKALCARICSFWAATHLPDSDPTLPVSPPRPLFAWVKISPSILEERVPLPPQLPQSKYLR